MHNTDERALPFGTLLGMAPGDIPSYSSDYDTANSAELPDRHAYRNYVDGVYTGYKWQCVEFARRWLLQNKGYIFEDVSMAYDIFKVTTVSKVADGSLLPLKAFKNGSRRKPEPGCMLIWNEGGEFEVTGHVAIVTEVHDQCIRIAEQNMNHQAWQENCNYSRQLPARCGDDGSYWIQCSFSDAEIMGWVVQTEDATFAENVQPPSPELMKVVMRSRDTLTKPSNESWLNIANPDEAAYVAMNGYRLSSTDAEQAHYFVISKTAEAEIKRATNELNALFMHATDYVLQNQELLEHFNIPEIMWPRILQSWGNRRNQMITGRFDFCMTEAGLKVYEYNADSASCHMECGKVQGLWAKHFSAQVGSDAGELLFKKLVTAWKDNEVDELVHIMLDDDQEETYHALYIQSTMKKAGIESKMIHGVGELAWNERGEVVDGDGLSIQWVWKTWAWETALDQLRDELNEMDASHANIPMSKKPQLKDVLFQPETLVIEPLWTLVTSNKAILPILWELFPDHPYLLNSQFELTENLQAKGYVAKPIAGRCGLNISIVDKHQNTLNETHGQFVKQNQIYQELCKLPNVGGYNVQMCSFLAGGSYAGICVRVDSSLIITNKSDILPLRIVEDDALNG